MEKDWIETIFSCYVFFSILCSVMFASFAAVKMHAQTNAAVKSYLYQLSIIIYINLEFKHSFEKRQYSFVVNHSTF